MTPTEVAQTFNAALEAGDFETAKSFLVDGFQFTGAAPEALSAREWMDLSAALKTAMPDLSYNFEVEQAEGDKVTMTAQLTGTQTADLDLPGMGLPVVPATGRSVSNPRERVQATVKDGKLTSVHVHSTPSGGLPGVLSQLGVELPHPHHPTGR